MLASRQLEQPQLVQLVCYGASALVTGAVLKFLHHNSRKVQRNRPQSEQLAAANQRCEELERLCQVLESEKADLQRLVEGGDDGWLLQAEGGLAWQHEAKMKAAKAQALMLPSIARLPSDNSELIKAGPAGSVQAQHLQQEQRVQEGEDRQAQGNSSPLPLSEQLALAVQRCEQLEKACRILRAQKAQLQRRIQGLEEQETQSIASQRSRPRRTDADSFSRELQLRLDAAQRAAQHRELHLAQRLQELQGRLDAVVHSRVAVEQELAAQRRRAEAAQRQLQQAAQQAQCMAQELDECQRHRDWLREAVEREGSLRRQCERQLGAALKELAGERRKVAMLQHSLGAARHSLRRQEEDTQSCHRSQRHAVSSRANSTSDAVSTSGPGK